MNEVILVNDQDEEVGTMNKLEAHKKGLLHRAFSIFIFSSSGQLLMQQRAMDKYHSGGLWSNTCCSHPKPGEGAKEGATRRLLEEMGLDSELYPAFTISYHMEFPNGMIENEIDHVFVGRDDLNPDVDSSEVMSWKYMDKDSLLKDIESNPEIYAEWFRLLLPKVVDYTLKNPI